MKFIIFIITCLCVTLSSTKHARRGLWLRPYGYQTTHSDKECDCNHNTGSINLNQRKADEIQRIKFPQDPECGIYYYGKSYNNPDGFDQLDLPWMVSVTRENDTKHLCDGVLIYPDVVMTSAHCLDNDKDEKLMITAKKIDLFPREKYQRVVSEIHINPSYRACSRHNSLAILILSRPFVLDNHIKIACLPVLNEVYNIGYCVKKLMEGQSVSDEKPDNNHCGDRVFIAPNSSYTMGEASCHQGNRTPAFIKQTQSYSLSCGLSSNSDKFYYLGTQVFVELCGPDSKKYEFYDTLYKFMPWMHRILKHRFIYYDPDE